jgi:hypothetical protein
LLERDFGHVWEVPDIFLRSWTPDTGQSRLGWCAEVVEDLVKLIHVVTTLEERLAP